MQDKNAYSIHFNCSFAVLFFLVVRTPSASDLILYKDPSRPPLFMSSSIFEITGSNVGQKSSSLLSNLN
jgi:hypothetical protein